MTWWTKLVGWVRVHVSRTILAPMIIIVGAWLLERLGLLPNIVAVALIVVPMMGVYGFLHKLLDQWINPTDVADPLHPAATPAQRVSKQTFDKVGR